MSYNFILEESTLNSDWFRRFKEGEQAALSYVYNNVSKSLIFYGRKFIDDDFLLDTIIQESILKGWEFRKTMESMMHIYCFMRMNVKWKCLSSYNNPHYRFYKQIVYYDNWENCTDRSYLFDEELGSSDLFDDQKINDIYRAVPYLSGNRKTIMMLHFKYGLSYKRIAHRYSMSNQAVSFEIQKALAQLKKIINGKKAITLFNERKSSIDYSNCMSLEMWTIFRHRYENKMSFNGIAEKMNLSQGYIQQQYIEAHKRLQKLKAKRA